MLSELGFAKTKTYNGNLRMSAFSYDKNVRIDVEMMYNKNLKTVMFLVSHSMQRNNFFINFSFSVQNRSLKEITAVYMKLRIILYFLLEKEIDLSYKFYDYISGVSTIFDDSAYFKITSLQDCSFVTFLIKELPIVSTFKDNDIIFEIDKLLKKRSERFSYQPLDMLV